MGSAEPGISETFVHTIPMMTLKAHFHRLSAVLILLGLAGCDKSDSGAGGASGADPAAQTLTLGVAFETLQTEYWVAGYEAIKAEATKRGFKVVEAVADNDANRQLEQVKSLVARHVDGFEMTVQ